MGTYCTTTSLQTLMVGTEFDTATTSLASLLITDAENEIDKYLSKRYDTSAFTAGSVPPIVTTWAQKLTQGYMYQNMSRGGEESMKRGQFYIDQVMKNLELVREYKLDVLNTAGAAITDFSNTAYKILSNNTDYTPTFNEDDELNWKVDTDKLDAIDSDRD